MECFLHLPSFRSLPSPTTPVGAACSHLAAGPHTLVRCQAVLARRSAPCSIVANRTPGTPGIVPDRRPFPLAQYPSKCSPLSQPLRVSASRSPSSLVRRSLIGHSLRQKCLSSRPVCSRFSPTSGPCSVKESVAVQLRFQCWAARYFLGLIHRQIAFPEGLPRVRALLNPKGSADTPESAREHTRFRRHPTHEVRGLVTELALASARLSTEVVVRACSRVPSQHSTGTPTHQTASGPTETVHTEVCAAASPSCSAADSASKEAGSRFRASQAAPCLQALSEDTAQ